MVPFFPLAATAALLVVQSPAQSPRDSTRLDDLVVSASRTTAATARVRGSAADALSSHELRARQLSRLGDALRLAPGSGVTLTGAPGGVASLFVRGTNSGHTLLLVDGIRVSDANLPPGALVGGFSLAPADRVEIVRGPQSPLYGGAAIGGVISIDGDATPPGWRALVEAGELATYRGELSGSATAGRLRLSGAVSAIDTENERPDNQFDQRTQAFRATWQAAPRVSLGASFRGAQQSYTSPGDIRTSNTTPVGVSDFEHHLTTAFADVALSDRWSSRLTAGWQDYFLRGRSRFNGGPEFTSLVTASRWVADWQHRVRASSRAEIVAGANAEWITVGTGDGERDERLRAAYAEVAVTPAAELTLSAGLRADDHTTFDGALTGRITAAYFLTPASLKLRATLGTAFLPPSLSDRFGSVFQHPNPGIKPERSTGWDAGADLFVARGRGVLSVTAFENRLRDLIGFEPAAFPELGRSINVARARTRGLELSGRLVAGPVDLRGHYTHVSAVALDEPDVALRRLIRRPAHTVGADVLWTPAARVELGGGVSAALDREDTDFNVFPFERVNPGDVVEARLHGRADLTRTLRLRARVDNLFNERYEEVYGFPAPGRRATVGLEIGR